MAWRMLKSFYEPQNSTRKLMLNHKLYNIKMNEGTSMNDFITDIKDVVTQLASIRKVIQEECWEPFIAMNHLSRDFLTQDELPSFENLAGKLILDKTRRGFKSGKRGE